jgi:hypothetical protein
MKIDTIAKSTDRFYARLDAVVERNALVAAQEDAKIKEIEASGKIWRGRRLGSKPLKLRIVGKLWDREKKYYLELPERFVMITLATPADVVKAIDCIEGLFTRIGQDGLDVVWSRLVPTARVK